MPERSMVLTIVGLVVVACLFALGFDLYQAARTGPRWKRRLVGAGLFLLATLGLTSYGGAASPQTGGPVATVSLAPEERPSPAARPESRAAQQLGNAEEWHRVAAIWREAGEIASGKRGDYPFDRAGKKRVLDALAAAEKDVEALEKAGLLTKAEAGILKKDLPLLVQGVQMKRPTEMRMATCYEAMAVYPARESLTRLSDRLPLLGQIAASDVLKPQVLSKVLQTIEGDIAILGQGEHLAQLSEARRAEAEKVRNAAKARLDQIRTRLRGDSDRLQATNDWRQIVDAWKEATPLAQSGQSTTRQREAVKKQLDGACEATGQLVASGLLSQAEAQLLRLDAERLLGEIRRNPPTDSRVLCYDMAVMQPAYHSFDQLSKRLPLLQRLIAQDRIQPAVLKKVIATIEADVKVLSNEKELNRLGAERRAKAEETRRQTETALAEIKALIGEIR